MGDGRFTNPQPPPPGVHSVEGLWGPDQEAEGSKQGRALYFGGLRPLARLLPHILGRKQ